jgi:parallel beta-helix repeat protein
MSHGRSRFVRGAASLGLVAGLFGLVAAPVFADGGQHGSDGRVLYVSKATVHPDASGTWSSGCRDAAFTTIGAAVAAAGPGATVIVCPGTYREGVVIDKALTVVGEKATIEATGHDNGVQVIASHVTVRGFTVTGATGEGILVGYLPGASDAMPISHVAIRDDTVVNNDLGNPTSAPITDSAYAQCNATIQPAPAPAIPGDCGEGIHLLSVTDSTVAHNRVSGNSGGILLTDENGPTSGNVIKGNNVYGNLYDCGITVAGHNIAAAGGIHDNKILGNRVVGNGVSGQGAGVLLASPVPGGPYGTGGAVFDNLIAGNYLAGNGLAGVTVHSHAPGQNLNGNVITYNVIGTNNLDGDPDFFPLVDPSTTGVIVASVAPLTITISHNRIVHDVYGIWLTPTVTASGTSSNTFIGVTTPVGP